MTYLSLCSCSHFFYFFCIIMIMNSEHFMLTEVIMTLLLSFFGETHLAMLRGLHSEITLGSDQGTLWDARD